MYPKLYNKLPANDAWIWCQCTTQLPVLFDQIKRFYYSFTYLKLWLFFLRFYFLFFLPMYVHSRPRFRLYGVFLRACNLIWNLTKWNICIFKCITKCLTCVFCYKDEQEESSYFSKYRNMFEIFKNIMILQLRTVLFIHWLHLIISIKYNDASKLAQIRACII